jgi:hypothetical protein
VAVHSDHCKGIRWWLTEILESRRDDRVRTPLMELSWQNCIRSHTRTQK